MKSFKDVLKKKIDGKKVCLELDDYFFKKTAEEIFEKIVGENFSKKVVFIQKKRSTLFFSVSQSLLLAEVFLNKERIIKEINLVIKEKSNKKTKIKNVFLLKK